MRREEKREREAESGGVDWMPLCRYEVSDDYVGVS